MFNQKYSNTVKKLHFQQLLLLSPVSYDYFLISNIGARETILMSPTLL